MNAQENKLTVAPIGISDFTITVVNKNTIDDAYKFLVEKKVFDAKPPGAVLSACVLEFIGDDYKYKKFLIYIKDPEDRGHEGTLTGTELFSLYDLLGMNKLVRYFTPPEKS